MKAILRGIYIAWCTYNKRRKSQQFNDQTLQLKDLEKEQINTKSRRQKIIKIRAEINETETKETIQKLTKEKVGSLKKINITDKPLAELQREVRKLKLLKFMM